MAAFDREPRFLARPCIARVASAGWRDFYEGDIGRKIAASVRAAGGILTAEDMARFEPRVSPPYLGTYRGAALHGAILSNGGLTIFQMLNMLENFLRLPPVARFFAHQSW